MFESRIGMVRIRPVGLSVPSENIFYEKRSLRITYLHKEPHYVTHNIVHYIDLFYYACVYYFPGMVNANGICKKIKLLLLNK